MSLISTVFEATRFHCTPRTDQCTVAVISFKRERERRGVSLAYEATRFDGT